MLNMKVFWVFFIAFLQKFLLCFLILLQNFGKKAKYFQAMNLQANWCPGILVPALRILGALRSNVMRQRERGSTVVRV